MKHMPLHILWESWQFMIRKALEPLQQGGFDYCRVSLITSKPVYLQLDRQVEAIQSKEGVCVCVCVLQNTNFI